MKNLVEFTRDYLESNYGLAERLAKSKVAPEEGKEFAQMILEQSYGAVDGLVAWQNYRRDPEKFVDPLISLWDEYHEKFNQLLEK